MHLFGYCSSVLDANSQKSNREEHSDACMASEITPPSPAAPRLIGKIRPDDDRVRIVGTVKNVNEDKSFLLEDNTGAIQVKPSDSLLSSSPIKIAPKTVVRACGTVEVSMDGGRVLRADLLQDFSNIDLQLYHKVREVINFEVVRI